MGNPFFLDSPTWSRAYILLISGAANRGLGGIVVQVLQNFSVFIEL